jgi:hypothetical protein
MDSVIPYYPDFFAEDFSGINSDTRVVKISSYLRQKHNGIWYKVLFVRVITYNICLDPLLAAKDAKDLLRKEVYNFMLFGKIDPKIKNNYDEPVFPEDEIQIEEDERLIKEGLLYR